MIKSGPDCKCPDDYKLVDGACIICPDSQYATDGLTCLPCNQATCKRCSGSLVGMCTQCISSSGYIKDGLCVDSCPNGTMSDDGKNCYPCLNSNCKTCSSPWSSPSCTLCNTNYYLQWGTCSECSSGFYSAGITCQKCEIPDCLECSAADQCTLCANS